ncbi:MAG TPA: methionine ABC transporter permease, partial [Bacillota bacterium]|nr:methionine ABC transporter permease [Bacillota bacterium]
MLAVLTTYQAVFWRGTVETIYMTGLSTLFAYLIGLPMGILLFISQPEGISPSKSFHLLFGWIINIGRSIPFTVLLVAVVPFTRLIAGK